MWKQIYCSPRCQLENKIVSARAARKLWKAAGQPGEEEIEALEAAQ
jgi:hypothetical protein